MMNQMLGVSKERLKEIFDVPRTAELWREIEKNENYKKMHDFINEELSFLGPIPDSVVEVVRERNKQHTVELAMIIYVEKGWSFDDAVQEVEKEFLKALESITSEELKKKVKQGASKARKLHDNKKT